MPDAIDVRWTPRRVELMRAWMLLLGRWHLLIVAVILVLLVRPGVILGGARSSASIVIFTTVLVLQMALMASSLTRYIRAAEAYRRVGLSEIGLRLSPAGFQETTPSDGALVPWKMLRRHRRSWGLDILHLHNGTHIVIPHRALAEPDLAAISAFVGHGSVEAMP